MSLRARNRRRAMRSAQQAALDLFERHGFDAVPVEDIAEAAGMSPSTVYRHFGTKEQLVLWDELDSRLEQAFREQLSCGDTPLAAIGRAFAQGYSGLDPEELRLLRRRGALIDTTPSILAAQAQALDATRTELQQALAQLDPRRPPLHHELTARIGLACLVAGFEAWQANEEADLAACIEQAFGAASDVLRPD